MKTIVFHPWYWLVLGLALIGLESLGMGGFLLGGALSGVLMGAFTWIKGDIHWTTQLILFSCLTIVLTLIYWRVFKKFNQKSDNPKLNDRAAQLQGSIIVLKEGLPTGSGRIQIGDTLWKAKSKEPLKKGASVVVYDNKGMVLLIKPTKNN